MTRITALDPYRKPAPPGGPFAALTWPQQRAAEQWLYKFCQRWGSDLPPWRRAILIGTAKRLALHPPAANFGNVLHGYWGAKANARKHRAIGIESYPGIVAAQRELKWKRAGRPALPSRQLPI